MPVGESPFNNRPQEKLKVSLLLPRPGGRKWHNMRGHTGRSRWSAGRENGAGPEAHASIRVWGVKSLGFPG